MIKLQESIHYFTDEENSIYLITETVIEDKFFDIEVIFIRAFSVEISKKFKLNDYYIVC
ncbi:hypothetical protein NBO_6g0042 [Nosema bombycis CQ1]|uniref:Uncharacterized protein n=1 Tax=Nosema bombycis (strain CQ1 / CVCC 102059) TaxID=578461 RepID=R0MM28_NOSB1|nr:hypothetical protein NBO_6g0042 [Nosema bombycis CQ1]|eukprot:EOB15290.1 hypothetical protein NBO_6g0042 [Nosema bombycis CQ1]